MKLVLMAMFFIFLSPAWADGELIISDINSRQCAEKHWCDIYSVSSRLAVIGAFSWSYFGKRGAIILANDGEPNGPKACVVFGVTGSAELIFGSDPHQSCRIIGKPQVKEKDANFWVFIPVEIDASGGDENYIAGGINLLLDKARGSLCSPEAANAKWMCRRQVSENFYKIAQ
jgi:hypothetical protein